VWQVSKRQDDLVRMLGLQLMIALSRPLPLGDVDRDESAGILLDIVATEEWRQSVKGS